MTIYKRKLDAKHIVFPEVSSMKYRSWHSDCGASWSNGLLIRFTALLVLSLGATSCTENNSITQEESLLTAELPKLTKENLVTVRVIHPEMSDVSKPLVVSGTIAAKQTSNIGALAEGVVERVFVKVGDRVKKGQPLFRTRQVDFQRKVDEAKATLAIASAQSNNAETLYQRYANLIDKDAVSRVDYEDIRTKAEVAKAQVALREAQLLTAQQVLTDTVVRAPFNGAITARYIDEGVFMSNSFSGLGNSSVVQIRECEIAAGILFAPESEIGNLALGLKGNLYVDGKSEPISATIAILNDGVDPAARTVEFRMPFENENCAVKAGQSVRAELNTPARTAIVLLRQAVKGSPDTAYVFTVQDNVIVRKSVSVRDIDINRIEILSGLVVSDIVVLSSSTSLQNGMKVTIDNS